MIAITPAWSASSPHLPLIPKRCAGNEVELNFGQNEVAGVLDGKNLPLDHAFKFHFGYFS